MKPVFTALALASLLVAGPARAEGDQDFVLHNHLGKPIMHVYVTEADNQKWEDDVLGSDILDDGDDTRITFAGYKSGVCKFDVKVVDADDDAWVVKGLDACNTTDLTLTRTNGKVTYRRE